MKAEYSWDGVRPDEVASVLMEPLVEKSIVKVLHLRNGTISK